MRSISAKFSFAVSGGERGAVLILVALLAATLILVAGLAIDSAVIASSKTQQRHAAEYMALGSLKAFFLSNGANNRDKLNDASDRAEEIARQNSFLGKSFLVQQSLEQIGSNMDILGTDHGVITPGKWYFDEGENNCDSYPENEAPCPCSTSNTANWATPCFRELEYPADNAIMPNAIQVVLKTSANSPLRTLFGRISGKKSVSLSSSATAVKVARRGVFMVDLSSSSHNETHIPFSTSGAYYITGATHPFLGSGLTKQDAGEYVYLRDDAATSCSPAPDTNPCWPSFTLISPNTATCDFEPGFSSFNGQSSTYDLYDTVYGYVLTTWSPPTIDDMMMTPPNRLGRQTAKHLHFQDDYQCFDGITFNDTLPDGSTLAQGDSRYDSASAIQAIVDTYTDNDPNNFYDGPEPLTTMLHGINKAANLFETNFLPDDEITVIGFDSSARIDKRKIGPIASKTDSNLSDLKKMSDVSIANQADPDHFRLRINDHIFFPRLDPHLNLPEALEEAKSTLLASGKTTAENFVVVISDGVSTCFNDADTNCLSDDAATTPLGQRFCRNCSPSFEGFQNSFQAAEALVLEEYIPNNIKLHFVHIGTNTSPHTLLRVVEDPPGSGNKSCMSQEQAVLQDLTMVDNTPPAGVTADDSFKGLPYGDTFHYPAVYAELVRQTGGQWIPLGLPCQDGTDIRDQLETACESGGGNGSIITNLSDNLSNPITDDKGRVGCDPYGRARRTQIEDAMEQIFNVDPYILVD